MMCPRGKLKLSSRVGVLSASGDVSTIREKHVDLNLRVRDALAALPIDRQGMGRIRQGGLDGLCRANGISGKTGSGVDAPALFRKRRIEELLDYCAAAERWYALGRNLPGSSRVQSIR